MTQPDASLSPASRALAALSTLGVLMLIYMVVFMHAIAEWWMWAIVIGVFILPAAAIVFVERGVRSSRL